MQALVELIDKYRPGFATEVEPAPEDIVEQLSDLTGPLPGAYRRFLATMGGNTDGFSPLDVIFNVEDRLLNYELNRSLRGSPLLLIAAPGGPLEPGGNLFMDRNVPYGKDDCLLVVIPPSADLDPANREPLHAGLEEFLYVEAYRQIRLPLFSSWVELTLRVDAEPSARIVEAIFAVAGRLGFQRIPPAARCALFEREDAAMVLYRHPISELFSFQLATNDQNELRRLADVFARQAPLRTLG